MGEISIWQLFIMVVYTVIIVIPCWRILKKAGYSPALSLLAIVPLVNIIALWFFAFAKWPKESPNA